MFAEWYEVVAATVFVVLILFIVTQEQVMGWFGAFIVIGILLLVFFAWIEYLKAEASEDDHQ